MTRVVLLRFEATNLSEGVRQHVLDMVARKFEGTGTFVTSDPELAAIFDQSHLVVLHDGHFDTTGPESLGQAFPELNLAEVNVSDVLAHIPHLEGDTLADALGTLAAHEAGHLILPFGHSLDLPNLMSPGHRIVELLAEGRCDPLEFTQLQRVLLAHGQVPEGVSLAQLELAHLGATSADPVHLAEVGVFRSDVRPDELGLPDAGWSDVHAFLGDLFGTGGS